MGIWYEKCNTPSSMTLMVMLSFAMLHLVGSLEVRLIKKYSVISAVKSSKISMWNSQSEFELSRIQVASNVT